MMTKYVASIDQGTTSTRFIIFTHAGEVVASEQKEHNQIYPKPGWVEHDPIEIWQATQDVIRGGMKKAGICAEELAAIGITNQRETTVIWDRETGKPYFNAVVWMDTRTDVICNVLAQNGGQDRFREKVGLPLSVYFSGPKIKWLLDNVDGLRKAAEEGRAIFGNIDTWLIWNMTGGVNGGKHITDVTNAGRTMLMNLNTLSWDQEILNILNIPLNMLPEIRPSSDPVFYGLTESDGPFKGEIPVCGDLGDQHAALVGQTCFSAGEAKNTYGTGCFMLMNTGSKIVPSTSGLLTTMAYQFGDQNPVYALEGSIAITGALVQWLQDNLGLINSTPEVEILARTVEDSGGIYFVPAFSGLFAPYWRSDARGVIVGMTRYINKGHIARATLEATAYQTREVLEAMRKDSGVELHSLKVDGGMVKNELLMQFQADLLGVPVVCPKVSETTALGAAYAAGLAVGFWQNQDELRANWGVEKKWEPEMPSVKREDLYRGWLKAVTRTFDWVE
ncbi:MAG: glycerol kinase GlpK [Anaerolineales bacterium]|nr:glycerol kinase GlpK [Anaerolineales bacterium]